MGDGDRRLSAILLAAGEASRMEACKVLLPIGGRPALEVAVERLGEAGIGDVVVVTGFHGERVAALAASLKCRVAKNPDPGRGMFSSVRWGVAALAASTEGAVLLPADIPLVKPRTIRDLVDRLGGETGVIIPSFAGRTGHPAVFGKAHFGRILRWEGPGGLRGYFESLAEAPRVLPVADQAVLMDMDTPPDYEALLDYWKTEDCPNPDECEELLKLAETPPAAAEHGRAVARVAMKLARGLPPEIRLRRDCLEAAALLHDLKKGSEGHEEAGSRWVEERGYPGLARLIGSHRDLAHCEDEWEACLLYLADKLVQGTRIVSLEGRMEQMRVRFAGDSEAVAAAETRLGKAMRLRGEVETLCGKSVDAVLEEP